MIYECSKGTIDYTLIYKKRKTMGIYVDLYGHVELRVPTGTSMEMIEKLLEDKKDWIFAKSKEQQERTKGFKVKEYNDGETFLYMGKNYPICITIEEKVAGDYAVLEEDCLHLYVKEQSEERIRQTLKRFYYQQCKALAESRIKIYQPLFKTKPREIKITDNKKTWGTCNSNFQLTFNWKLAMAPLESIDYVVVHEMCHMVHLNHDRSFWRLVGKILPDYEERQAWLHQSSWKMVI